MVWLNVLYIILTVAFRTLASSPLNVLPDSPKRKSASSPEILILDETLKSLKSFPQPKTVKNKFNLEDDTKNRNPDVLQGKLFVVVDSELPKNISSLQRPLVKREAPGRCGKFPCPEPSSTCPFPPCSPPVTAAYLRPGPPPVLPYVPQRQRYVGQQFRPAPTYITPMAPRPVSRPAATYISPVARPAVVVNRPRPAVNRPRPAVNRPRPAVHRIRPGPRPRPRPPIPTPICPPISPNFPNQLDNLKNIVTQLGQCNTNKCNANTCTRRRRVQKCTIDYDTLFMRLSLIHEKLLILDKIETRLKIHAALLLNIQRNPQYPGEAGPEGNPGHRGHPGMKGPTGAVGHKGACIMNAVLNPPAGDPGPPGNKGDPGHLGDKICNCNGDKGDVGDHGENVRGPSGPTGYKGSKGQRGH